MSRPSRDLESRVITALAESSRGPLKTKELAKALKIAAGEYRSFRRLLTGLEKAGKIVRRKGHRYALPEETRTVTGILSLTKAGDGFIRSSGSAQDVFVPGRALATAMDGDRVVARIDASRRGKSPEGVILRILDRATEAVVGTFFQGGRFAYVRPLDRRVQRDVLIAKGRTGSAKDGDVVVLELLTYGDDTRNPTGAVDEVLGRMSDPGVDVLAVAYAHGLSPGFPEGVTEAAKDAASLGAAVVGEARIDRTDLPTFTIDPADAKDHDDALSWRPVDEGFEVGIHIADVSHFVEPNSPVDVEAQARGTSVYLVDRTIPMLPDILSGDVCSLIAGEPRLAISLFLTLDEDARVLARRYERTTIKCSHSLSYRQAQAVLDGTESISPGVDTSLRGLHALALQLRERRAERGAVDLDIPEAVVLLDDNGAAIDVQKRERQSSHRLVEDFMILANEAVADDLEARGLPGLFRIHEPPSPEKAEGLQRGLAAFGVEVPARSPLRPSDLQKIVLSARGTPAARVVSSLVLRSMQKARYAADNLGHFGLASTGYAHFTSPIRRYPDLVVHRAIAAALVDGKATESFDLGELAELAERCSVLEQAAEEAERASIALKKVEYMQRHLGETFTGTISGVAPFGFFVTLDAVFVEGLVHVSSLSDDFYQFSSDQQALTGAMDRRRFRLGDAVEVQVSRADKELRQIDFVVLRSL